MMPSTRPTTILKPQRLARYLSLPLTIASETFQHTGSFKFRAAGHVASNTPQKHIIAASSGNFGQALACACEMIGKTCTIVMPATSARVKIDAVREFGGAVDLIDTRVVSRAARVRELLAQYPDAYAASAYDDPLVIAGNATLGAELAALRDPFDCILAPLGGGGLTAGIIQGLRAAGSSIPVIAVEPVLANDGARSFRSGHIIANESEPATIADGVRTLSLGQHNWVILREGLADVIEVTEEQIKEAVRLLFHLANLKVEPTGGLPVAALLAAPARFKGQSVCCIASGGNVDAGVFRSLI